MVASVHYQCLVKAGLAQSLPTSDVANSEVYDQVELFRDVVLARKGNWTRASWTRHSRVSESQHYMHVRTSTSWLSVLRYVLKQVCLRTTCAIIALSSTFPSVHTHSAIMRLPAWQIPTPLSLNLSCPSNVTFHSHASQLSRSYVTHTSEASRRTETSRARLWA